MPTIFERATQAERTPDRKANYPRLVDDRYKSYTLLLKALLDSDRTIVYDIIKTQEAEMVFHGVLVASGDSKHYQLYSEAFLGRANRACMVPVGGILAPDIVLDIAVARMGTSTDDQALARETYILQKRNSRIRYISFDERNGSQERVLNNAVAADRKQLKRLDKLWDILAKRVN